MYRPVRLLSASVILCVITWPSLAQGDPDSSATEYRSHAPKRPLPRASERPLADGPAAFCDAARGDDSRDGSERQPWKTLAHALRQLRPGDTLLIKGSLGIGMGRLVAALRADAAPAVA